LPNRKDIRFFVNYFVGPLLFVVMAISIYRQIIRQENLRQKWDVIVESLSGSGSWRLYVVVGLMLVNWGLEAKKWQILLQHIAKISFLKSFKSVLSGVAFTMVTPNRMGEFIGRVFYVAEGQRIRAATLTIVGSISQLIVTFGAGLIGLLALGNTILPNEASDGLSFIWMKGLLVGIMGVTLLLLAIYFKISWLVRVVEKIPAFSKYVYFIDLLDNFSATELLKILSLSIIRYLVFVAQYLLLFQLFGVSMPWWQGFNAVSVMFLILAIVPMPGIAELGIRGKASIALFTTFSSNAVGILVTSGSIWLINLILPAIIGSLLVLNVKLFNKIDEKK
jgi:uncharacterized membrane protein YbhN (UPF0104 family)